MVILFSSQSVLFFLKVNIFIEVFMSPQQALQNVALVVRSFKGTYDEHKALEESVNTLIKLVGDPAGKSEVALEAVN